MLYQIPSFLLDVIVGLLGGACLLRLYMQYHRVPFGNPLGRFVFAVTDWIVLPLRRIVPSVKRWDLASAVAAWLLVLVKFLLLWLLMGGARALGDPAAGVVHRLAATRGVRAHRPADRLRRAVVGAECVVDAARPDRAPAEPLVRPLRRFIPLVGGVDLSPLAPSCCCRLARSSWAA